VGYCTESNITMRITATLDW